MFDYLIVGSGLFGAVVAHEMKKQASPFSCWSAVLTGAATSIARKGTASGFTSTAPISSILPTKKSGTT